MLSITFPFRCNLHFPAAVMAAEVVDVEEAAVAVTEAEGKIVCSSR